jgi:glucose/arabinose dehydrogenase
MVIIISVVNSIIVLPESYSLTSAQERKFKTTYQSTGMHINEGPLIKDANLKVEVVYSGGISFPTSMAFLGPNDILVLEKNSGTVRRIINSTLLEKPLLHVNVLNQSERGMLGIAISKNSTQKEPKTYVFLYLTQRGIFNHLYRYELADNRLVNPKLLLNLPGIPGARHNGGAIMIGPDNNVYVAIGDVSGYKRPETETKAQNYKNGTDPDGRAGILRITQDGKPVGNGILGNKYPLNLYYAYGIRNSFGIDFDPVTGNLWDTENGDLNADEINLVYPGFNSGWSKVQGIWQPQQQEQENNFSGRNVRSSSSSAPLPIQPNDLVDFNGKGKYRDPQFDWNQTVGPTAIKFLNSDKYGKEYQNDMFVADFNNGNIYHFDLNKRRTQLHLDTVLKDKIANNNDELHNIIFGTGFGGITDMEVGPDGYLYILSIYEEREKCDPNIPYSQCFKFNTPLEGTIFRIIPQS